MVKVWHVQCDFCPKVINALKEPFYESDNGQHACEDCFNVSQVAVPVVVEPVIEVPQ